MYFGVPFHYDVIINLMKIICTNPLLFVVVRGFLIRLNVIFYLLRLLLSQ